MKILAKGFKLSKGGSIDILMTCSGCNYPASCKAGDNSNNQWGEYMDNDLYSGS